MPDNEKIKELAKLAHSDKYVDYIFNLWENRENEDKT